MPYCEYESFVSHPNCLMTNPLFNDESTVVYSRKYTHLSSVYKQEIDHLNSLLLFNANNHYLALISIIFDVNVSTTL